MKIFFRILTTFFFLAMIALAYYVIDNANLAAKYSQEVISYQTVEEKLDTELKVFLDSVSFGIYDGGEEKTDSIEQAITLLEAHKQKLELYSYILLGMSTLLLLLSWFFMRQLAFLNLILMSLTALVVGLLTPVLSFTAFQDLPIIGQVVFKYDSRGILGSIVKLFETKSFFVAGVLFLFSVIVPFIKILLSLLMHFKGNSLPVNKIAKILHNIGKWSMLDVFVVAVFLALFALEQDGLTDARAGIGLYFFASYVLFSMLASQVFDSYHLKK